MRGSHLGIRWSWYTRRRLSPYPSITVTKSAPITRIPMFFQNQYMICNNQVLSRKPSSYQDSLVQRAMQPIPPMTYSRSKVTGSNPGRHSLCAYFLLLFFSFSFYQIHICDKLCFHFCPRLGHGGDTNKVFPSCTRCRFHPVCYKRSHKRTLFSYALHPRRQHCPRFKLTKPATYLFKVISPTASHTTIYSDRINPHNCPVETESGKKAVARRTRIA